MEAQSLSVEYEPAELLIPYANNAKIHTDKQIEQICESIRTFGFNDPIAVWTNAQGDSEIVEGHGRLLAAQELGIEEVPVIHLDRLTDEQRRAYTHVHNQLTMNTGWDFETLEMDMDEIEDIDWDDFGFDAVSIASVKSVFIGDEDLDLDEYEDNAESQLTSFNVIICCQNEDEKEFVLGLLGGDKLKRLYRAGELMDEVSDTDVQ